jgi:hypothetical protein
VRPLSANAESLAFVEEPSLNLFDDAADKFSKLAERWKNRLVFPGRSLVEQYKSGRLTLICDLEISSRQFLPHNSRAGRNNLIDDVRLASVVLNANVEDRVYMQNWNQEPVFIDVVQIVKEPENIIPSLVRLYDIHDVTDDCFGGSMYQSAIDGSYKFLLREP